MFSRSIRVACLGLLGAALIFGSAFFWRSGPGPAEPALLHPIERVFFSDDWRLSTERAARPGETVFVVVRTGPDGCAGIAGNLDGVTLWQMLPLRIDIPSTRGGPTGDFYEILAPRNAVTCSASRYVLAEWLVTKPETRQFVVDDQALSVVVGVKAGPPLGKPFLIGMSNFGLMHAYCEQPKTCKREAELGHPFARMLQDHHLQVMQNWVLFPPVRDGRLDLDAGASQGYSFRQLIMNYAGDGYVGFPRTRRYQDKVGYLKALERTIREEGLSGRAWVYAWDEPADIDAILPELRLYREHAPSVQVMVTTDHDPRLDGLVDIFAPVYNNLVSERKVSRQSYDGKGLWTYLSCMGACGPNRAWKPEAPKTPGRATGHPDLLIDRTAEDLFRYFETAVDLDVDAGLYFEAVEPYPLIHDGVDPFTDTWNFGGNGHGLLIFPGQAGEWGLDRDQPLPSFRLKLIRHAIQSYW